MALENEIRTWLDSLPEEWKLNADVEPTPNWPTDDGEDPSIENEDERVHTAQRCELAIGAHRLVMKLYAPFLPAGVPSPSTPATSAPQTAPSLPSHQAVHGAVNAAHVIVQASRLLWAAWGRQHEVSGARRAIVAPALFDFCSFERGLVDAAVVCAWAAVRQPGTIWASVVSEDVAVALDVLMSEGIGQFGEGRRWDGGLGAGEAVGIVEALRKKTEVSRGGHGHGGGTKRKHSVSPKLKAPCAVPGVPDPSSITRDAGTLRAGSEAAGRDKEKQEKERKEKDKKHARTRHYPAQGVRIRPGRETPFLRRRGDSVSTTTTTTTTTSPSSDGKMPPPLNLLLPPPQLAPSHSHSHASSPSYTMSTMIGVPRTPVTSRSPPSASTEPTSQHQQPPSSSSMSAQGPNPNPNTCSNSGGGGGGGSEYPFSFGAEEDVTHRRRFSIHDMVPGTPTTSTQHQQQQQPPTPVYAGYSGDAPTSYGQQPFDSARHVHSRPGSSFAPPPLAFENASAPSSLSLPSPNFGTASGSQSQSQSQSHPHPHSHMHLPSPTPYASRHHNEQSMYGSSGGGPGGPPQGLYLQTAYEGGHPSLSSPVPGLPSFENTTHVPVYGVKASGSDRPHTQHPAAQSYHAVESAQEHGMPMAPGPTTTTWPQTSETYWNPSYAYHP